MQILSARKDLVSEVNFLLVEKTIICDFQYLATAVWKP
jgi:hypothetical protein